MYKISFVVLFACLINSNSHGQTQVLQDSLDLLNPSGKIPANFTIKRGGSVRYRFINFNTYVYTATLNAEHTPYYTDKPAIFNVLSNLDLTKLTPPATTNSGGGTGEPLLELNSHLTPDGQEVIGNYLDAYTALSNMIDTFMWRYDKVKMINAYNKRLADMRTDGVTPFNNLYHEKITAGYNLIHEEFGYTGSDTNRTEIEAYLGSAANRLFIDLNRDYAKLVKRQNELKPFLPAIEEIAKQRINNKKMPNLNADDIVKINLEVAKEKFLNNGLNELVADAKALLTKVNEMDAADFPGTLVKNFGNIDWQFWEYLSQPFEAQKDKLTIKIDVQAKEETRHIPSYKKFNRDYTGTVEGFKMDFSSGLFLIMGKKMFDKSYRIDTIPGDPSNNMIVENENKKSLQPAAGALMHFYDRKAGWFNWGGAFGLSISSETKLNYHGGLSFMFGEEQRTILSLGATLASVKEISDSYKVSQKVLKTAQMTTVPTDNFYRWGFFLAFTYNLTK